MAPDGKIWGCHLFPEYLKGKKKASSFDKYCFGEIDNFIENFEIFYPHILENHSNLSQDHFYTDRCLCRSCDLLYECSVCPLDAALYSGIIGKIPLWNCIIQMLLIENKRLFRAVIKEIE
jgi:hypothetical protein